ncbi:MAG: hypothetical protein QF419_04420, partial [Acidimicrobiales bacterium]|nr:hypothetical protein [Acidimicrobiales bacterium]
MGVPDRGGIVGMASLQEFLEVLGDAYPDEKVRGKEFEPFLRDALVASPSHQFADVEVAQLVAPDVGQHVPVEGVLVPGDGSFLARQPGCTGQPGLTPVGDGDRTVEFDPSGLDVGEEVAADPLCFLLRLDG